MKNNLLISIILIVQLFASCSDDEGICTTDIISRANAGFYVRDSLVVRDTLLSNFSFYATLRPDSLIYDSANTNEIIFPLPHGNEDFTSFVFLTDTLIETLNIYHTPMLVLVSFECGFTTNHNIYWVSYENIIIDTIVITDPWVDLENYENLKIYIKPAATDTAV